MCFVLISRHEEVVLVFTACLHLTARNEHELETTEPAMTLHTRLFSDERDRVPRQEGMHEHKAFGSPPRAKEENVSFIASGEGDHFGDRND